MDFLFNGQEFKAKMRYSKVNLEGKVNFWWSFLGNFNFYILL